MQPQSDNAIVKSSFRDPSGFVFYRNGILYRQINITYKENYDYLMDSGLYEALVDADLLIAHNGVTVERPDKWIATTLIGASVAVAMYWRKLKTFYRNRFRKGRSVKTITVQSKIKHETFDKVT